VKASRAMRLERVAEFLGQPHNHHDHHEK